MKSLFGGAFAVLVFVVLASSSSFGQTFAPTPHSAATQPAATQTAQIQELTKKIDEQNAKIDMLSQQILKLQLEISQHRPGVMIGEGSATTSTASASTSATAPAATTATDAAAKSAGGNNHVVARGETLIAIARMYNVS